MTIFYRLIFSNASGRAQNYFILVSWNEQIIVIVIIIIIKRFLAHQRQHDSAENALQEMASQDKAMRRSETVIFELLYIICHV